MKVLQSLCVCGALAVLGGCASNLGPQAGAPSGDALSNGVSPMDNYKSRVLREAMLGLDYSSGYVTLSQDAGKVAQRGSRVDADRAAAVAATTLEGNLYVEAIRDYTKAVIVDPTRAETYAGLGLALSVKGRNDEAFAAYKTALKLNPELPEALRLYGRALDARGDYDEAIATYENLSKVAPGDAEAPTRLAVLHLALGRAGKAAIFAQRAEALGGSLPPQVKEQLGNRGFGGR